MQQEMVIKPRLSRIVFLVGLSVALAGGGCTGGQDDLRLTTAMGPTMVKPFQELVDRYNDAHPGDRIAWRNATSEAAAVTTGDTSSDWAIVSAAAARKVTDRQAFLSQVSPRSTAGLIKGFRPVDVAMRDGTMLPLVGTQPVLFVDVDAVSKGMGSVPSTIGDVLKRSSEHRRKMGRYFFLPAFGDPSIVLRFLHAQGATLVDAKGQPAYPAGELQALLAPWLEAFRRGDMPNSCLDWDEVAATRHLINREGDVAIGGSDAVAVLEARSDKSRRFNVFRPFAGVMQDQWIEPIGLIKAKKGNVTLAAQNMIAFLLQPKVQMALANGYQASPLVEEARRDFGNVSKGVSPAMEAYISTMNIFVSDGVPLAPLSPDRDRLAAVLRQTLVDAVQGMPLDQAIAKGKAAFEGH